LPRFYCCGICGPGRLWTISVAGSMFEKTENSFRMLGRNWVALQPAVCDSRHHSFLKKAYIIYSVTMGRLSKAMLLSLLLILAGATSDASLLCAQPMSSQAHACCRGHKQAAESHCGMASVQPGNPCSCTVLPVDSTPLQNLPLSTGSSHSARVLRPISGIAGELPAATLFSGRGSPRPEKLQHSSLHALLCTFLV